LYPFRWEHHLDISPGFVLAYEDESHAALYLNDATPENARWRHCNLLGVSNGRVYHDSHGSQKT
jgi:hypothetical protein